MNEQITDLTKFQAKIFKALSDPLRIDFLNYLREEKCVCEVVEKFSLVQPLVSRHLRILSESGLVQFRKDGNKRLYKITDPKIYEIINSITPDMVLGLSKIIIQNII